MGSVNRVTLLGHLGRDAEMRHTSSGTAVATLNLATSEVWTDRNGEKRESTDWHRVVLWGKLAERLEPYLTKGKQLYIEGSLHTRQWEDREGQKRYTTEVRAGQVVLLGGGSKTRTHAARGQQEDGRHEPPPEEPYEDEVPF